MKLFIRFRGLPLRQIDLDKEKTYRVGRSSHNDVQISAREIPRQFGEVRFENDQWFFFYRDQKTPALALTENDHVWTPYGLELGLASYLDQESTYVSFVSRPFKSKGWMLATASCALLALVVGIFSAKENTPVLNSKNLMQFAEDRIVKFELKISPENLSQLKKDAGLGDEDFKTSVGFCTGFAVDRNVILTAQHCVVNPPGFEVMKDFVLRTSDGREVQAKRILAMDYLQDYLFLEVEGLDNERSFQFAKNFEIGEKVYTIGNVSGEGLAIRDGIVSGETEDQNNPQIKHIRFSAAASPGNSGGPLLNTQGEIVALVSRKNNSENYNIGIHFRDLQKAKTEVIDQKNYHPVVFDSKYSEMGITVLTSLANKIFGIKFPDFIFSRSDLAEKFKNFQVEIPMPLELNSEDLQLEQKFEVAFKKLSVELDAEAKLNQLPGLSWESQPTADFPVVIPAMNDVAMTSYKKINSVMVPLDLGLYGHSGYFGYDDALQKFRKNKTYRYQPGMVALRGSLVEQRIPRTSEKGYLVYSSGKDSKDPLDFSKMFYESPDFSISFMNDKFSPEQRERLLLDTFEKVLFGDEGAVVSLKFFPFLRPKAKSDFKLKTFPEPIKKVATFKDEYDRDWNYYATSFYGSFYTELFCTENFQSTHCLTSFRDGDLKDRRSVAVQNFVRFELSEKFALNEFFPLRQKDKINALLKTDKTLKDFSLTTENNELVLHLTNENKRIKFSKLNEIQSIRFIPVVKKNVKSGPAQWQGYAAHVIRQTASGASVCAQGIDPELYGYHDFINDSSNQLGRRPASRPSLAFQKKAQKEFHICVPLMSGEGSDSNYDLNFLQKINIK